MIYLVGYFSMFTSLKESQDFQEMYLHLCLIITFGIENTLAELQWTCLQLYLDIDGFFLTRRSDFINRNTLCMLELMELMVSSAVRDLLGL